jgi:hypothetical protein
MKSFHEGITLDRWKGFAFPDQLIMVANEVHRARTSLERRDAASARLAYLRALDLFDLTVQALGPTPAGRLRELLRWREVLAGESVRDEPDLHSNLLLLETLLRFSRRSAAQVPHVCRGRA